MTGVRTLRRATVTGGAVKRGESRGTDRLHAVVNTYVATIAGTSGHAYGRGMQESIDRRTFFSRHGTVFVAFAGTSALARAQAAPPSATNEVASDVRWPSFQQQDHTLVREVVGASHRNLERVTELVTLHPALANAAYDWGFGDWETALGAASHVGNHEIATVLLEHGARLDVFAAAMLGMTDVVRAILTARPSLASARGPHGIPLLAHALAGGDEATIEYLKAFDGAGTEAAAPLKPEEMQPYLGTYTSDVGDILVTEARTGMMLQGRDKNAVRLTRTGEHTFHPAGAPNVRIAFSVVNGKATRMEIVEADWLVSAVRGQ